MNSWSEAGAPAAEDMPTESLEQAMVRHCRAVLERCGGNISRAAQCLGIQRNTLKKYLSLP